MRVSLSLIAFSVVSFSFAQSADFFSALNARSVGPTSMGGRITAMSVFESDPRIYYIAAASGGVWKTTNGGLELTPIFDKVGPLSTGAIAVSQQNSDLVWLGTGEATSRNSVAWGDGVYKTTDGGKTWANMGLKDSKHIGMVAIHPKDNNTVYAGALGSLWGPGGDRGLYKTKDGGKTWKRTLYVDENTGIIDIDINPKNPNEMFAATWQRRRWAYNFNSGGPGSGIWKSTDAGETWKKVTKGLPGGPLGRIGIDYFASDPKILVASVERPANGEFGPGLATGEVSGGLFRSTDGGNSWTRQNIFVPRAFYFSRPTQDPIDPNRIWVPGVELSVSTDAGKTIRTMNANVHADIHTMWVNPKNTKHILLGCDGGLYESVDQAKTWRMHDSLPLGQFYGIAFDMRKPYWVYGGLQDNNSWGNPTQTSRGFVGPWDSVAFTGGDGFHVQIDPEDYTTVYSESQGGAVTRVNQLTGESRGIRPPGADLRFNWSTPIVLSPWNSKTVYVGANKLFRSNNRGDNWMAISPDLTTNDPSKQLIGLGSVTPESTAAEQHCTIITVAESPRKQGVIWVGSDDGLVHVTEDDGKTWTNVTPSEKDGLPKNTWVSRVTPSKFENGRCYATFDGHRANDFKPYVYMTEDYGKTWKKLSDTIADGWCTYVIREGVRNEDLLFVGTEMGLLISMDRGATWTRFNGNFPNVSVHDLAIHPRELDLVIGTHGRSIYTLPIGALDELDKSNREKAGYLCKPATVYNLGRRNGSSHTPTHPKIPNTQPGTTIFFHLLEKPKSKPIIVIQSPSGESIASLAGEEKAGLQGVNWVARAPGLVGNRELRVVLRVDGAEYTTSLTMEDISANVQQTK